MSNKNQWGGARKGAGAPVTVGEEGRRKPRAIQTNNDEYTALQMLAKKFLKIYKIMLAFCLII